MAPVIVMELVLVMLDGLVLPVIRKLALQLVLPLLDLLLAIMEPVFVKRDIMEQIVNVILLNSV